MAGYKGMSALVTGASSGIGREFALQLAGAGANLVVTARRKDKLEELAGEIKEKHGSDIFVEVIDMDLSLKESPERLFDILKEKRINIDLLVNNAGFGLWGKFEDEKYEKIIEMNMLNMITLSAMCRLFIPSMLERKKGGVINVASTAAFQPIPYFADYAASKAFVLSLSEALWQEYRDKGITISALCPGWTDTGFQRTSGVTDSIAKKWEGPEIVVKDALSGFLNGKPLIVPGVHKNVLLDIALKILPLKVKLKTTADLFSPRRNK